MKANGPGLLGGGEGKSRNFLTSCINKDCHGFTAGDCQHTKDK
ncbi:MAG: hypothetical protein CM1200mP12_10040 [Gammaproteobacteria bacterium]|jgi:hypothetical protein|nr:MAG: hypothetical protein CM1200mP12_10040 [Gammaproteobacteria bacterium]